MRPRIDRVVVSGVFSLDGQDFDVDNNVWLVGDDDEVLVIDAPHDAVPILAAIGGRRVTEIVLAPATILYIEDNASNVRLMNRLLGSRPSLTLVHAPDGHTGLATVRERKPSVILLDLHLPDIPGDEVLRQLKGDPELHDVPVIVLSADATPGQVRRLLASGATAYLTKPFVIRDVLAVVDRALIERPRSPGAATQPVDA